MNTAVRIVGAILILTLFPLSTSIANDCIPQNALYITHETGENVLKKEDNLFSTSWYLAPGSKVCVQTQNKRWMTLWLKVRVPSGMVGWIDSQHAGTQSEYIDSIRKRMEIVFAEWEAIVDSQEVAEVEVPLPPKYQHWIDGTTDAMLPAQPDTVQATVKLLTQIRSGPGTEFPVAGTKSVGDLVEIDGMNSTGTWLRLTDGTWILRRALSVVLLSGLPTMMPDQSESPPSTIQDSSGPTPTPLPVVVRKSFGDGIHQVNIDIDPGVYYAEPSLLCYFARLRGFSGEFDDIIANGTGEVRTLVSIKATDTGFESVGCGTWQEVLETDRFAENPDQFGDGYYRVGIDINPGTYRSRQDNAAGCYWERLSGFDGGFESIIANGFTDAATLVTIRSADTGFMSTGCGFWTKQ